MGCSRFFGSLVVLAALVVGVGEVAAPWSAALAQERGLTDGVYSDSQATRGGRIYRQTCSSCHATNLEGGEMGPGLLGQPFLDPWDGESLAELMAYVQETMPQDNPGGLSEQDYTDVLAYMLKVNEFPSGEGDLTLESVAGIVIEPSQ
jgi:mono/diheme cytochrome c family protein